MATEEEDKGLGRALPREDKPRGRRAGEGKRAGAGFSSGLPVSLCFGPGVWCDLCSQNHSLLSIVQTDARARDPTYKQQRHLKAGLPLDCGQRDSG